MVGVRTLALVLCLFLFPAAACSSPSAAGSGAIHVVAGENFWGSIVSQLAGRAAKVTSVVSDPNADPHKLQWYSATGDERLAPLQQWLVDLLPA